MSGEIEQLGDPRPLTHDDAEQATRGIARAFAWHEPWGAWGLPDEATRESILVERIGADIRERFLPLGECWTIGAVATTLWVPPLDRPGTEPLAARRSEADYASFGEREDAMRAGDDLIAALRPETPHWYLDTIAVAPEWRRMGLGGRLLDHDLAVRDVEGGACALDTHTDDNIAFYRSRGFEVIGEGELGPALPVYMMLRQP